MLAWRLLLATGDPACADVIERTMYNGVLPGVSVGGTEFFYVNTLQRRTTRASADPDDGGRKGWFACACCPPNIMRLLSSWPQYLATTDEAGIQIHQYAAASFRADVAGSQVRLDVDTDYPWCGEIAVTILESPDQPWTLSMRIPAWCRSATVSVGTGETTPIPHDARMIGETRPWRAGDRVVLTLDMPVRVTDPDPRIDAVRGCVALERGPLVYCVETADLPVATDLEDIELEPTVEPVAGPRPDIPGAPIGLTVPAIDSTGETPVEVGAVPYFAWAHRKLGAMRVWIPTRSADRDGSAPRDR